MLSLHLHGKRQPDQRWNFGIGLLLLLGIAHSLRVKDLRVLYLLLVQRGMAQKAFDVGGKIQIPILVSQLARLLE